MKKSFFKKALALVSAAVMTVAMATVAFAADDIALDNFNQKWDTGSGSAYTYMGWVGVDGTSADYKYIQITYTGDATAFDELRLEFMSNNDTDTGVHDKTCWAKTNDEGTILTTDGKEMPAPSATAQTVILDLKAMGINLTTGIKGIHVHNTQGKGAFTVTGAKMMTSVPTPETEAPKKDTPTGESSSPMTLALLAMAAVVATGSVIASKKLKADR